jgi:hypothetical protein
MFSKLLRHKKGQIANSVMTVIFGTILLVAVAIPITLDVIADANLTGLTATVVGFIPLFLGLAGLVLAMTLIRG